VNSEWPVCEEKRDRGGRHDPRWHEEGGHGQEKQPKGRNEVGEGKRTSNLAEKYSKKKGEKKSAAKNH